MIFLKPFIGLIAIGTSGSLKLGDSQHQKLLLVCRDTPTYRKCQLLPSLCVLRRYWLSRWWTVIALKNTIHLNKRELFQKAQTLITQICLKSLTTANFPTGLFWLHRPVRFSNWGRVLCLTGNSGQKAALVNFSWDRLRICDLIGDYVLIW